MCPFLISRRTILAPILPSPIIPSCISSPLPKSALNITVRVVTTLSFAGNVESRYWSNYRGSSYGFSGTFEFWNNALRQDFAELDAPLIERIDVPEDTLSKHRVLVKRDQLAECFGVELSSQDCVRRTIAFKDAVRHKPIRRALAFTCSGVLPNARASAWANTLASRMS